MITHVELITPIVKLNLYDYSDAYILVELLEQDNGRRAMKETK